MNRIIFQKTNILFLLEMLNQKPMLIWLKLTYRFATSCNLNTTKQIHASNRTLIFSRYDKFDNIFKLMKS